MSPGGGLSDADLSPLRRRPGMRRVLRYARGSQAPGSPPVGVIACAAAVAFCAFVALTVILLRGAGVLPFLAAVPALWALAVVHLAIARVRDAMRGARIEGFARANGLAFTARQENVRRPGLGFPSHLRGVERDVLSGDARAGAHGIGFALGRHRAFGSGHGSSADVRRAFVFVEVELGTPVPHLVLKNRRARILPLAGISRSGVQRLALEGDYAERFRLFVVPGGQIDALVLLTPDVIEAVLEFSHEAELELVDGRLTLYLKPSTAFWKPEEMRRLLLATQRLVDLLEHQTSRYAAALAPAAQAPAARVRDSGEGSGLSWVWAGIGVATILLFVSVPLLIGAFAPR